MMFVTKKQSERECQEELVSCRDKWVVLMLENCVICDLLFVARCDRSFFVFLFCASWLQDSTPTAHRQ